MSPQSSEHVASIVKAMASSDCPLSIANVLPDVIDCKTPYPEWEVSSLEQSPARTIRSIPQLDLAALNSISSSTDGSIVSLGVGALWQDVYSTLQERNLTIPGPWPVLATVGETAYGLASDNVLNLEVRLQRLCTFH